MLRVHIRRKIQEEIISDDVIKYSIVKEIEIYIYRYRDIYAKTELRLPGKL